MVSRARVALPYAVVGALGAYLYLEVSGILRDGGSDGLRAFVILLTATPLVAGGLGVVLDRQAATTGRGHSVGLATVLTIVAGVVNGIVCGIAGSLTMSRLDGGEVMLAIGGGGIAGAFAAVPYLAPTVWTANLARNVGRARSGTLVDRSDLRWVWAAVAPSAACAALLVELAASRWQTPTLGVIVVPSIVILGVLARMVVPDLLAWRSAEREKGWQDPGHGEVRDLGVGDETLTRHVHAQDAYRDVAREVQVPRGDATLAATLLRTRFLKGVAIVVGSGALVLFANNVRAQRDAERRAEDAQNAAYVPPQALPEPTWSDPTRTLYTSDGVAPKLLGVDTVGQVALVVEPASSSTGPTVRSIAWTAGSSVATPERPVPDALAGWIADARRVGVPFHYGDTMPLTIAGDGSWSAWVDRGGALIVSDNKTRRTLAPHARGPAFAPTVTSTALAWTTPAGLFVADPSSAAAPSRVPLPDVRAAGEFVWDPHDATMLYALGTTKAAQACVFRVDVPALLEKTRAAVAPPLFCAHDVHVPRLVPDPSGTTAALCDRRSDPGAVGLSCTWLELASGSIKGRLELAEATDLALGPRGLIVARTTSGVAYASFRNPDARHDLAGFMGELDVRGGAWLDGDGTFVTVRPTAIGASPGWELVSIDVDRVLDPNAVRPSP